MEKATLPPEIWDRRLIEWASWRAWMKRVVVDPMHGLPLFAAVEPMLPIAAAAIRPEVRRSPHANA